MPQIIIDARAASLSTGLNVKRILPFRRRRMVGPFIFLDHAGPVSVPVNHLSAMDVLPHPHIGLSTVTYLLEGQVTHRDSLGVEQIIRPGEVNWMTAGKGISHSERFENQDLLTIAHLEMLQTWVALPEKDEETEPSFINFSPEELPVYSDAGIWMRLIAGDAYGLNNKVKTHSPLFYIHIELETNAKTTLPAGYSERGVYIIKGDIEIGIQTFSAGQLLVFDKNDYPTIIAKGKTTLMLLGGEPLGDRYIWWNFVSSRKDRIEQAKADWENGRIILPPNDNREFVPLPDRKSSSFESPEANVLS
ncbi:MAG: pirin family protein [Chitinophagales bacterium]|nr:pirin family protein [Chitinophagales bacterium]MCZ2394075.1 pirin family protein [Chitinophagales bacterium]